MPAIGKCLADALKLLQRGDVVTEHRKLTVRKVCQGGRGVGMRQRREGARGEVSHSDSAHGDDAGCGSRQKTTTTECSRGILHDVFLLFHIFFKDVSDFLPHRRLAPAALAVCSMLCESA